MSRIIEDQRFVPTETWDVEQPLEAMDESIQQAVQSMNAEDPKKIIHDLKKEVQEAQNGVRLAILRGEKPEEYSNTEAMVMFNPFAHAATPNMLVRAELIRRVARLKNVRDSEGKLKSMIMVASPGLGGSNVKLTPTERDEIRKGDRGTFAKELLAAISEKGLGKIALFGFSEGADLALASALKVNSANLDTMVLAIGDPVSVKDRSVSRLALDFMGTGMADMRRVVARTKLDAQKTARGMEIVDLSRFGISSLSPLNLAIMKSMGVNSFEQTMQQVIDEGKLEKIVVGYGAKSRIAQPQAMEPLLQALYDKNGSESLVSIKVDGASHAWGDQLTLLTKLYMRALT